MIPRSFFAVFALVLVLLLPACSPSAEVSLDEKANGSEASVSTDQTLSIRLESNITTGYSWEVSGFDEGVLELQGEPEYVTSEGSQGRTGAGGVQVFRFKPIASGKTHLKLVYHRPWEEDVEPVETFDLDVTVK